MRPSPLLLLPVLAGIAVGLAASPASLTDEVENYRQLQAMPRERRVALLENLEKFDKLDPSEQARIRKLNAQIAANDPDVQRRYLLLMRRYEFWVKGLSDEQKEALRSTDDPDARFKLALEYRKQEQSAGSPYRLFGIRTGYYNLMGPFEAAQLLRIWQRMPAGERYQIEHREGRGRIEMEIREYGKKNQIKEHRFPIDQEKHYDEILNANEDFKKQLNHFADRMELSTPKTKADRPATRFRIRFAEFLYFEDPAHKPKAVSQQNLEKFSNFCPTWFHSMLDSLSSEDARNYLTIVYRLLFPEPAEITAEWKPAREKQAGIPGSPRPTPKRPGPTGPI